MASIIRFVLAAPCLACVLAGVLPTQPQVIEIPAMTVPHSVIDMDRAGPPGPTSIAQVNRAGSGAGGSLADLLFTPGTAAQGVYDTNITLGRALARTTGPGTDLILIDPPAGVFGSFDARIDLAIASTEFGLSVGDWVSTMVMDFYLQGRPLVTGFVSTRYSTAATKFFQMRMGVFDRVDVRASTTGGNWCIPELVTQVPAEDYTPFGKGCPGTGGTPRLGPITGVAPRLGRVFQAGVVGMPLAGGLVFVALGTSETVYAPLALPFELGMLGAPGCRVWCSYTLLIPLPNVGGSATYNLPIPSDPALIGARFYNQVLVPDPAANPFGLTLSNGARGLLR